MIKGILIDKDGTLLDFNRTWLRPYQQATRFLANSVGKPKLADVLMEKGGFVAETKTWSTDSLLTAGSNKQILQMWSEQLQLPVDGERLRVVNKIFSHAVSTYVPVLEDLPRFLGVLKDYGQYLGLATIDDESNAYSMLNQLELTEFFDFVCGADSGYGIKPDPGIVLAFCKKCGLDASNVVIVGDSPIDLAMGSNANVRLSVGVLTGAYTRSELDYYADRVFDNIEGLLTLFTEFPY